MYITGGGQGTGVQRDRHRGQTQGLSFFWIRRLGIRHMYLASRIAYNRYMHASLLLDIVRR